MKTLKTILKIIATLFALLFVAMIGPKLYEILNQVTLINAADTTVTAIRVEGFGKVKTIDSLAPGQQKTFVYKTAEQSAPLILAYRFNGEDKTQQIGETLRGMGWGRWNVTFEKSGTLSIQTKKK